MRRYTLIVKPKFAQKIKKALVQRIKYQMVRNEVKISSQNDFFNMNGLIWYEIDYFRTEMTFSIFWKPVDCSGFDFSSVYDRKRRSDHEEYPLVAQLSTSIQISVIETFSEQPNFEDILQ